MDAKQSDLRWRNSPTAWFAVLERALMDGDQTKIDRAMENLRRLGIKVQITEAAIVRGAST